MEENNLLTTQELSKYLKLNEKTILKMAQFGELPGVKIGSQWRFYLSTVDEYLQDKIVKSSKYNFGRMVKATDILPLSRFIDDACINLNLSAENKEEVLYELAETAQVAGIAVSKEIVYAHLKKREDMLSTALGKGVAIPHPRNPSDEVFKKPGVIIGRSIKGVDFSSPDAGKIHLFFMTCAPDVVLHLNLLSKIAALLEKKNIYQKIMNAQSKSEVIKIFLLCERISV